MMQWSNFTKCGLFFNIVSPAVHTRLPSVLQRLDFRGYRSSHPDPRKSPQLQIMTSSSVRYGFKATVTHSSHYNHRFVCKSIVLVKQDSLRQFSRPSPKCLHSCTFESPELLNQCGFYLEGTNAVRIRKGEI